MRGCRDSCPPQVEGPLVLCSDFPVYLKAELGTSTYRSRPPPRLVSRRRLMERYRGRIVEDMASELLVTYGQAKGCSHLI
jgi:hypothetical protein